MNVVSATFGSKAPSGSADELRALADAIDRGEVKKVVCAADGVDYQFVYGASLEDCVTLSTLLQWRCMRRMEG